MNLGDFTSFEKFLTPKLIQIAYWIGIIAIVLGGIGGIVTALFSGKLLLLLMNIIGLLLGLLFWRVLCVTFPLV